MCQEFHEILRQENIEQTAKKRFEYKVIRVEWFLTKIKG